MISVRHLLLAAAAAVALAGTSLILRGSPAERREPAVPPPPAPAAVPPAGPTTSLRKKAAGSDLRDVPAGIIARAANARSLERAPACRPLPRQSDAACPPHRDTVEIRWDVAKEP